MLSVLDAVLDIAPPFLIGIAVDIVVVGEDSFVVRHSGVTDLRGQLLVLAGLTVPLVLWVTLRYQRRLEPRYAAVRHQVGVVSAALSNNLGGIATIKAFGAEDREWERIHRESETYRQVNREAIRLSSAFIPLVRLAILAGCIAILLLGGLQVIDGPLEVGASSVMILIVQRLLWPLTRPGETFDLDQRAMASTRRILDLIAEPVGLADGDTRSVTSTARSSSRTSGSPTTVATSSLSGQARTRSCHRPRSSAASTCASRPASPTPSSARQAPGSRRS